MNEAMIDAAARKLCELREIDPDEIDYGNPCLVRDRNGSRRAEMHETFAREIRARLQVDEAIAFAREK